MANIRENVVKTTLSVAQRLIEHLVAWVAFIGFVFWTIFWWFLYALQGGWGGIPRMDAPFLFFILKGYVLYGCLLTLVYLFYGRARFLPWRSGTSQVRDFFILIFLFSLALAYFRLVIIGNIQLGALTQLSIAVSGTLVFLISKWTISRVKSE